MKQIEQSCMNESEQSHTTLQTFYIHAYNAHFETAFLQVSLISHVKSANRKHGHI